jgi:hypothetical protein
MRRLFLLLILITSLSAQAEDFGSQLTAGDLAKVLGMYWWNVQIPTDLGPKDSVQVAFVNAHGRQIASGVSISPGPANIGLGQVLRIFCWEDKKTRETLTCLEVAGGAGTCPTHDFFRQGAFSPYPTGSTLKPNDVLLKFHASPKSAPSFSGGNGVASGEIGLELVVRAGLRRGRCFMA